MQNSLQIFFYQQGQIPRRWLLLPASGADPERPGRILACVGRLDSMSPILLKGEVVVCLNIPVCSSRPLHVSRATKMPQQARHSSSVLEWRHPCSMQVGCQRKGLCSWLCSANHRQGQACTDHFRGIGPSILRHSSASRLQMTGSAQFTKRS